MDDAIKKTTKLSNKHYVLFEEIKSIWRNDDKSLEKQADSCVKRFWQSIITAVRSWNHQRCAEDTKDWPVQERKPNLQPRWHLANYTLLKFSVSLTRWRGLWIRSEPARSSQNHDAVPGLNSRSTEQRPDRGWKDASKTHQNVTNRNASCSKERLTRAARPHLFS